jgi:tetratricopeptide (TPR) repeat protein
MHDKQGTVYAFRSELETWRSTRGHSPAEVRVETTSQRKTGGRNNWIGIAMALPLAVILVSWWLASRPVSVEAVKGWVLITQFDNRTGEPELDGTLEYAMERELSNSRHVQVFPRFRINDALALMERTPDTRINGEIGREISLRDGEVRYLVNGRIEKLGETYTLYADLVTPADGVIRSSYSAVTPDAASILSVVRQVAGQIREALGEEEHSIERSAEELERVTTPSLEALKLYSQANTMMMGIDRQRAVPVLQQALHLDPDFASAHLLLWYALRDRDQLDEAMSHLERAVELAEDTTERERLFILATYYQFYLEDLPRAIETFELLARLYPDHFWAISNLASLNEKLGYHDRAYPYQLRRADLRPGPGWHILEAARAAAIYGDEQTREVYATRAQELQLPWIQPHLVMLPYETKWLDGEFESLSRSLDRWTSSSEWQDLDDDATGRYLVQSLYLSLGNMTAFRSISGQEISGGWLEALVDLDAGDHAPLDRHLDLAPKTFWTAMLLATAGRTEEARTMLDDPETTQNLQRQFGLRDWKNMAEGELAFAEERCDDAVALLGESVPNARYLSKRHYLFGANTLAMASACAGRLDDAIEILEQARREKQWSIFEYAATYLWFRNQLYLRDLYVSMDKPANADAIDMEIDEMLVIAQQGFPIKDLLFRTQSALSTND